MRRLHLAALAFTLLATSASADLLVTLEHKDLTSDPPRVEASKLYLTPDKVKVEGGGPEPAQGARAPYAMIYRGDRDIAWVLDPQQKTYMTFDKKSMQEMGAKMDDAMKQMQDALAKMPPEQRQMAEQMMKGRMPAAAAPAAPTIEVKPTGEKRTLDGRSCDKYDCLVDGKKTSEIWVTKRWGSATPESFTALQKMAAFYKEALGSSPMLRNLASQERVWNGFEHIEGIPVLIRQFDGDTASSETLFKSVDETKLAAGTFDVPAGFTQRKLGHEAE